MSSEVQDKVLDFVSEHFQIPRDTIDPTASLVDQGVIDSFGFVEIVAFLEEEFSIAIADEEINVENFGSIKRIVALVATVSESGREATEPPLRR